MPVIELTKENFDEVIKQDGKVLVDFWAEWCGPCRVMNPVINSFSEKYPDITVAKVDIDAQGELAEKFNVMSIPTLIMFENGEPVETSMGSMPLVGVEQKFLSNVEQA